MRRNDFPLKTLAGAVMSATLLLTAGNAFADRAIYGASGTDVAVSSGSDAPGDILLFPYFTTVDKQITTVHLVNTSKTDTVVAKLRIREFETSNDGIDFTIIMSPNDVFSGALKQDSTGKTIFVRSSDDTTCTSPVKVGASQEDRTFRDKNQSVTFHTGHIEVITMATFNAEDAAATVVNGYSANNVAENGIIQTTGGINILSEIVSASTHVNSKNTKSDCVTVDSYFNEVADSKGRFIGALQDAVEDLPIASHLFGHFTIRNADGGLAAGGRPVTIANALAVPDFANGQDITSVNAAADAAAGLAAVDVRSRGIHNPCYMGSADDTAGNGLGAGDASGNSLVCGQFPKHYKFPSLIHVAGVDASAAGATVVTSGVGLGTAAENAERNVVAFRYFEDTIRAVSSANEWSRNDSNEVNSEMVITFPAKYLYRDNARVTAVNTTIGTANTTTQAILTAALAFDATDGSVWNDVDNVLNAGAEVDISTANEKGYFTNTGIEAGCTSVTTGIFDREEGTPQTTSTTSTSGTPDADAEVKAWCNEVTVLTFEKGGNKAGVTQGGGSAVIYSKNIDNQAQKYGWLRVAFNGTNVTGGLSTIGYAMWSRSFGNTGKDFGHIMDNVKFK